MGELGLGQAAVPPQQAVGDEPQCSPGESEAVAE